MRKIRENSGSVSVRSSGVNLLIGLTFVLFSLFTCSVLVGQEINTENARVGSTTVIVTPSVSIGEIRGILENPSVSVIAFQPGTYDLSGSFPTEHIFTINRSVTLRAAQKSHQPVLNIINTGFDPQIDNTEAGAVLVNAPGDAVEFDNLILNTNRSLDVTATEYFRIDGCEITTTGGPANSAVYLGDYVSNLNGVTGDVIIENSKLVAEPGGWTTFRENFNAGIFASFTPANYQIRNNYLSGNIGAEFLGANDVLVEGNTVRAQKYVNLWVSFGLVVANNPDSSVMIRNNKINMDLPAPVQDPFYLAYLFGFGETNGLGVQHGVAIHVGHLIADLPAYNVSVINNEVEGNASFMIWAYRVNRGQILNNRRNGLNLEWFDYNSQRNPPLVSFDTTVLGTPLLPPLPPYSPNFIGMDFAEYGFVGMIFQKPQWWKVYGLGYVSASEYCLMYSTKVDLIDNGEPMARFFDFNGVLDPTSSVLKVDEVPSTNRIIGTLHKVGHIRTTAP